MNRKSLLTVLLTLSLSSVIFGQVCDCIPTEIGRAIFNVPAGDIIANTLWDNNTIWVLHGPTYVTPGVTLTIEKGTIIKGEEGLPPGSVAALIIERGAQIVADGDSCCPIIFTAEGDNVDNPNDYGRSDRGKWGSLIILGKAPINGTVVDVSAGPCPNNFIEGLPNDPKNIYGGCDCNDNSGILRYVQFRHGGSIIGAANEINGLTLGGVGAGTTIDHIEVFANLDDGFEFFGGTVNCKYLVSAFNDDDDFDWDQGYAGKLQFLFAIKDSTNGDRNFELDNDDGNTDRLPYARAIVYNSTGIGRGAVNGATGANSDAALKFKENSPGHIRNSLFFEFPKAGVDIGDEGGTTSLAYPDCITAPTFDAELNSRCATGDYIDPLWAPGCVNKNALFAAAIGGPGANLTIYGTLWWDITAATTPAVVGKTQAWTIQHIFTDYPSLGGLLSGIGPVWNNVIANPLLSGYVSATSRFAGLHGLDPRPSAASPAFTIPVSNAPAEDPWFSSAPYIGAFNGTDLWLTCWTNLWDQGYLPQGVPNCCWVCGDADASGTVDISDAVYLIQYIFAGGPVPCPIMGGDADCSGTTDISDAVYLIQYIFAGGPAPCASC